MNPCSENCVDFWVVQYSEINLVELLFLQLHLIWQVFNLIPDQVSTSMSWINYRKKRYNDPTKVPHDWLLTVCVCELFGRVCAFINGGKSYLTLTWCCALNLIMIITISTNTDNIFQSDTATLMNQSKMEYISGHFHQRLRGSSFWEIYQRAFWLCSQWIQFHLVFHKFYKRWNQIFSFRQSSSIEVSIVMTGPGHTTEIW